MAASSIRFGPGVTKEVGMDFKNMGAKRVCVVTDSVVKNLNAMKQVEEGLTREGIEFTVFDGCRIEPKDSSYVPHGRMCGVLLTFWKDQRGNRLCQTLPARCLPGCWRWLSY
jgi:alcohol dehydrogenase class IV